MTEKDIINNVIDELERAIERIEELGEFEEGTITSDDELINDMYISIERLYEIMS